MSAIADVNRLNPQMQKVVFEYDAYAEVRIFLMKLADCTLANLNNRWIRFCNLVAFKIVVELYLGNKGERTPKVTNFVALSIPLR